MCPVERAEQQATPQPAQVVAGRYATIPLPAVDAAVEGRAMDAAMWMVRLWGERQGYACVCLGHGGHFPPAGGGYDFRDFEQRFLRWPEQRAEVVELVVTAAPEVDVFAGVLLRSRPSGKAGTAAPGQVAWADVDGTWTPRRAEAIKVFRDTAVWMVNSGSGRHVYVELVDPEWPERVEHFNRRLGALLDADAGWSETKLLRPPGTFNHKGRARGGESAPVRWVP